MVTTDLKEAKGTMQIFHRGNDGYSLVDAALAIFLASVFLLAVFSLIISFQKLSQSIVNNCQAILSERNIQAEAIYAYFK